MDDAMGWLSAANLEDLFYPLLGYLTYEGEVVGFVTEPLDGEPLLSSDNLSLVSPDHPTSSTAYLLIDLRHVPTTGEQPALRAI